MIPWRGKILTPLPSQLRRFKGSLDAVERNLGNRDPIGKEMKWKEIRLPWKGRVLYLTPKLLLQAQRNLNEVVSILNSALRDGQGSALKIQKELILRNVAFLGRGKSENAHNISNPKGR